MIASESSHQNLRITCFYLEKKLEAEKNISGEKMRNSGNSAGSVIQLFLSDDLRNKIP